MRHPGPRYERRPARAADFAEPKATAAIVTACQKAGNDRVLRAPDEPCPRRALILVVLVQQHGNPVLQRPAHRMLGQAAAHPGAETRRPTAPFLRARPNLPEAGMGGALDDRFGTERPVYVRSYPLAACHGREVILLRRHSRRGR